MHTSSRECAKEPKQEIGVGNTVPLENITPKRRARLDLKNPLGLVKRTRSSSTRRTASSRALRAPILSSMESYILSPSGSSRSTVKKLNANRQVGPKTGNPTIPPEPSDKPGTLNTDLT